MHLQNMFSHLMRPRCWLRPRPIRDPRANAAALTYADIADLALAAPVAAHVRLRSASPPERRRGRIRPAGPTRFYVEQM
jgi:hypothetical protein